MCDILINARKKKEKKGKYIYIYNIYILSPAIFPYLFPLLAFPKCNTLVYVGMY